MGYAGFVECLARRHSSSSPWNGPNYQSVADQAVATEVQIDEARSDELDIDRRPTEIECHPSAMRHLFSIVPETPAVIRTPLAAEQHPAPQNRTHCLRRDLLWIQQRLLSTPLQEQQQVRVEQLLQRLDLLISPVSHRSNPVSKRLGQLRWTF